MAIASIVILTSSPHIWGPAEMTTGVTKEKWADMKVDMVGGVEDDEAAEGSEILLEEWRSAQQEIERKT